MAGRALRDSKGRYAGSTRGWGAGRSRGRGGPSGSGGRSIKKKGSGVRFSRPAAAMAAVKRGASVGGPITMAGLATRSPTTTATGVAVAAHIGAQTYRKARTGRL